LEGTDLPRSKTIATFEGTDLSRSEIIATLEETDLSRSEIVATFATIPVLAGIYCICKISGPRPAAPNPNILIKDT
jgi:hypothetical protein